MPETETSAGTTPVTFSAATAAWFASAFAEPTPAQVGAWQAIGRGEHTLVVAPTGSGKTLAAFLSAIDRLAGSNSPPEPGRRCRVLYVSPLKALAADVERNLRSPLVGIGQAARRLGLREPQIRVATRSGDTSAEDRRSFAKHGADILITTPESLFLLLTSAARQALVGVDTVILDEVHAVAATKRGAHLGLSLERLDALLDKPAQRIGLSATVRPIAEVATFLAGGRPVTIVDPPIDKRLELSVVVAVQDMSELGTQVDGSGELPNPDPQRGASIWPHVEERVLDLIDSHVSTIVFANSRRLAERLTARLNELALERDPDRTAIIRAHHGSVSREQRQIVEEELKAGQIPAVVATSSLELGIDMGAVDLVIQVESPPSVAAGTQRLGRAGHQVGAPSNGVIFPKYRGDLLECAVVAERIRSGQIESIRYPRNPLDVLAQQIVAMVALDTVTVDELEQLLQRSASYATLPRSALEAVLDMLAGRYPSDAFAELRPRLVWDRLEGTLTGRAGAQRLAVTSGGTIPDRGLFGVFLASAEGPGRRVGELDEEMVYESRVGEVFLLGSSSWRIEEITHDRVLVTPAPGQAGKMPFWKGDSPGRPAELGRALGAFVRELGSASTEQASERARAAGLDDWAATNLLAYLAEQRAATGHLPTDRTVVVERFRDELGDWRLVVHSPFGAPVNAPWALAIAASLREQHGVEVQSMHSDDGIVLRLPDTTAEPPGAELAVFDASEIEALVTAEVGNSALFSSRFRECAARSLLLPKRDPRRRAPLWQQRQRANSLMQVARDYGQFPVVLEAMRECLQDVFDLPGLIALMTDIAARRIRIVEVQTQSASPFAQSLLFSYVGMFLYDTDAPLAERRAQALALDTSMLAELMGSPDLRDLLDEQSIAQSVAEAQRLSTNRRVVGADQTHDLLREVGDLSTDEALARGATAADLDELKRARRVITVRIGGTERWLTIEDAGRVRDALGVALPIGIPEVFTELVADPLGDLLSRFARTHGPFTTDEPAARLGLGAAVVQLGLERLVASGQVVAGEFSPGLSGRQFCGAAMLRTIRRRSLAALRKEVEPAPQLALARFLPEWQGVGTGHGRGLDGLSRAIEQLAGVAVPASALESLVLPARVPDYRPAMLDELTSAGEVLWAGTGSLAGNDGWIMLSPADLAADLLPEVNDIETGELHKAILSALEHDQALFLRAIAERVRSELAGLAPPQAGVSESDLARAMWDLVWCGAITNDTLAPVRGRLGMGRVAHRAKAAVPRARYGRFSSGDRRSAVLPSGVAAKGLSSRDLPGRWSRLPNRTVDPTRRALVRTEVMLDRYGMLTRGEVGAEGVVGGFSAVYPVLRQGEDAGRYRRGYFVEGLGAAQFGLTGAVDRLRAMASNAGAGSGDTAQVLVLAATDPANPYGAALSWPDRLNPDLTSESPPSLLAKSAAATVPAGPQPTGKRGHQPGRKAGAVVVMVGGELALYVERGGKTLLSFTTDSVILAAAAAALAASARSGSLGKLHVEKADGGYVAGSPLADALQAAGFQPSPRGLQLRTSNIREASNTAASFAGGAANASFAGGAANARR